MIESERTNHGKVQLWRGEPGAGRAMMERASRPLSSSTNPCSPMVPGRCESFNTTPWLEGVTQGWGWGCDTIQGVSGGCEDWGMQSAQPQKCPP